MIKQPPPKIDYSEVDRILSTNLKRLEDNIQANYLGIKDEVKRAIMQSIQRDNFRTLYDKLSFAPLSEDEGLKVCRNRVEVIKKPGLTPTLKRLVWHYYYLFGSFALIVLEIAKALFRKKAYRKNIAFSIADINLNSTSPLKNREVEFIKFCNSDKIPVLNNESIHYFVSNDKEKSIENYTFTTNRLQLAPIRSGIFGTTDLIRIFATSLKFLTFNIFYSIRNPLLSLITEDLAWLSLISFYNSQNYLKDYFITNTYLFHQPIWFNETPFDDKNFLSHIIYYSTNNKGLRPKNQKFPEEPFPYFRFIKCDKSWLWTEHDKTWSDKYTLSKNSEVVGSILFYLPSSKHKEKEGSVISVFDVPPFNEDKIYAYLHEHLYYYTSEEVVVKFLSHLVDIADELSLTLRIKVKRNINSGYYSEKYVNLLERLDKETKHQVLSQNTNIYDFISETSGTICIPFTSPFYVAKELGISSVFYDPISEANDSPYYKGKVVSSKEELKEFLMSNVYEPEK